MDTVISNLVPFVTTPELQQQLASYLRQCRKQQGESRRALAERSLVPASTIKKFETTGQISLRQFLLLWETLDDLSRLAVLLRHDRQAHDMPSSIDEVLNGTR